MPRADPKLVGAAIRRARWEAAVHWARLFAVPIVVTLALIGLFIFSTWSPPRHVAFKSGEIVGLHHATSETGQVTRGANVRLDDGAEVLVHIPMRLAVAPRQRVVLEVLHYDRPPKRTIYRFDHIEGAQAASDAGP